jgi:hypothetical protein
MRLVPSHESNRVARGPARPLPSHDWFKLASMPAAATLDDSVHFFLNRTQATVQCDSVNCEAELTETLETDTRYTRFILTLLRYDNC